MNNKDSPFLDNNSFENFNDQTTRRLKHPVITFFHLIFRSLALIGELKEAYNLQSESYLHYNSSLPALWLVFWQLHRELRLHNSAALPGLLDREEYHGPVHGRPQVVELHRHRHRRLQVDVRVALLGGGSRGCQQAVLHGGLHLLGRPHRRPGVLGKVICSQICQGDCVNVLYLSGTVLFHCTVFIQTEVVSASHHWAESQWIKPAWIPEVLTGLDICEIGTQHNIICNGCRCRMGQSDNTATMLSGMANTYLQVGTCGCGLVHVLSHSKYDFQKQMFQSMVGGLFKSTPQAANTATGGLTV